MNWNTGWKWNILRFLGFWKYIHNGTTVIYWCPPDFFGRLWYRKYDLFRIRNK